MTLRLVEADEATTDPASAPSAPATGADTDLSLVNAARSGDRAAFTRLYQRFAPMVHAILLTCVERADADDLTQEVFLQAMRRLHTLRDAGAVGAWLATLARNHATTLVRLRLRVKRLLLVRPLPHRPADGALDAEEVMTAIRSLPEAYRETLVMRLVEQMTGPEIALRTGLSHGSVRVNLTRGLKLLREQLGTRIGEPFKNQSGAASEKTT